MGKKFTVFDHILVPKHILLSDDEKEQVLKELNVRPNQLPLIRVDDAAARSIGAKPGDIIKIIRQSPTAGVSIVYRYVAPS